MYDTKIRSVYNEDITHTLTIKSTGLSDGKTTRYFGERIKIQYNEPTDPDYRLEYLRIYPSVPVVEQSNGFAIIDMPDSNLEFEPIFSHKWFSTRGINAQFVKASDWLYFTTEQVDVIVPVSFEGVILRGIHETGFCMVDALRSITMPNNNMFDTISERSFEGCQNLNNVYIGSGITYIAEDAFNNCTSLTTININQPKDSIPGSPWGATNAVVNWKG